MRCPCQRLDRHDLSGYPGKTLSFDCGGSPGLEYAWTIGDRGWVLTGDPGVVQLMLPTLSIP
jgi:hypothetical protein